MEENVFCFFLPGLVALRSEEVMEMMADDYAQKYRDYIAVVQEREFQAALKRKTQELKRMAMMVRGCCQIVCAFKFKFSAQWSPYSGRNI